MNLTSKYAVNKKNIRNILFCWNEKVKSCARKFTINLDVMVIHLLNFVMQLAPLILCHSLLEMN